MVAQDQAGGGEAERAVTAGPPIELIVLEYWNVAEQNVDAFLAFYEGDFSRAIAHCTGHAGMLVNVRSPSAAKHVLGTPPGPRQAISPHPFLSQLGTRTDAMVDFDALLQYEWNILGMQLFTSTERVGASGRSSPPASSWRGRGGGRSTPDATEPTRARCSPSSSRSSTTTGTSSSRRARRSGARNP